MNYIRIAKKNELLLVPGTEHQLTCLIRDGNQVKNQTATRYTKATRMVSSSTQYYTVLVEVGFGPWPSHSQERAHSNSKGRPKNTIKNTNYLC